MDSSNHIVIFGSYAPAEAAGVYAFAFDGESGALTPIASHTGITSPSFVVVHPSMRSKRFALVVGAVLLLAFVSVGVMGRSLETSARGRWYLTQVALLRELVCDERLVASPVLDDIAVDLQHPQPPQQLLVARLAREPVEVVEIARERRRATVASEFLGARFHRGHDW